ncbi:SMI1/KNR4 family protein [Peribacillus sp. NPDC094092]|uniref:SMI1/KNR4 family protein n=1 Tax=Peribacillus sp. NPDC094092 TaxID=3390611 RepID=UPI003D061838
MEYKFEYTYKKISVNELENFEKKFNLVLPEDFSRFLLSNNGGKAVNRRFQTEDRTITSSIILFFPLSNEIEENLESTFIKYNESRIVPKDFLPIGLDPANSLICLSLDREQKGKVYFCDMDYFEEDNELRKEFIKPISGNFKEFMDNLFVAK